jgi:glycosyltransferase involved in cell wall biosynthesis
MTKLLTIGMATYDDFDGVYFSIQALRMYHPILNTIDYEIVVVDNNPTGQHGETVKNFVVNWTQGRGRYIPYNDNTSTSVRNEVFKNAEGKYTICMDCHVLIMGGGIEKLLEYYGQHEDCKDIVQGPLIYDDLVNYSTEFSPEWRGHMYGTWNANKKAYEDGLPFEIEMMGLGLFSCETKNWLGFNPAFKGFGAEEGYIHEKFRKSGGKAICIPQLKWLHRFNRPDGVKYPLILEDRIWNYFVGWLELTRDVNNSVILGAYEHFKNSIPSGSIDNILKLAIKHVLG